MPAIAGGDVIFSLVVRVKFELMAGLMVRDGATTPTSAMEGLKKKPAARSWILLDSTGEETILDVDKYAIMHRVQIHARDLRILDPLLSYPSTILGREQAIVLNLEVLERCPLSRL